MFDILPLLILGFTVCTRLMKATGRSRQMKYLGPQRALYDCLGRVASGQRKKNQ